MLLGSSGLVVASDFYLQTPNPLVPKDLPAGFQCLHPLPLPSPKVSSALKLTQSNHSHSGFVALIWSTYL